MKLCPGEQIKYFFCNKGARSVEHVSSLQYFRNNANALVDLSVTRGDCDPEHC